METPKKRLEAIFAAALELTSTAQREVYLARVCAEDTALRAEVEALVEAYEKAGRFLVSGNDPLEPGVKAAISASRVFDSVKPFANRSSLH